MDKTHLLLPEHEEAFINNIRSLYRQHGNTINESVDRNDKKARSVMFSVLIDKNNGAPAFDTKIKMVTVDPLRDRRRSVSDDPNQGKIGGDAMDKEIKAESEKALSRKHAPVATPSAPKTKSASKKPKKAK